MPQHQDLHVLRGAAAGEQRQPAKQPGHQQVEEAEERDSWGWKSRSDGLHEFWHLT